MPGWNIGAMNGWNSFIDEEINGICRKETEILLVSKVKQNNRMCIEKSDEICGNYILIL